MKKMLEADRDGVPYLDYIHSRGPFSLSAAEPIQGRLQRVSRCLLILSHRLRSSSIIETEIATLYEPETGSSRQVLAVRLVSPFVGFVMCPDNLWSVSLYVPLASFATNLLPPEAAARE